MNKLFDAVLLIVGIPVVLLLQVWDEARWWWYCKQRGRPHTWWHDL